jgi:cytochrome c oxidase subunit 2
MALPAKIAAHLVRFSGLASLALCGCTRAGTGWQSALNPQGTQAIGLSRLIWSLIGVCALVWVVVMLVLAGALARRSRAPTRVIHTLDTHIERRMGHTVGSAVVLTAVIVLGLTLASFVLTRGLSASDPRALEIQVRGYQWWWEITYLHAQADQVFTTANEIHIPVGRTVHLQLRAADVIHSFWVPNLAGKKDLIPGRDNSLIFTAQRPGVYRGQCAEFCGLQHAHMALLVVVDPPEVYEQWRRAQLTPAANPSNPQEAAGQKVFTSKPCAACHSIQGTSAAATIGPDLTHVASRRYIASGLLQTTRGSLAAWIADPQTLKPGNNMPDVPLSATELQAVSAYLAGLK